MRNTFTIKLSRLEGREHKHQVIKNVVSIQSSLGGFLINTTHDIYLIGSNNTISIIRSDDQYNTKR